MLLTAGQSFQLFYSFGLDSVWVSLSMNPSITEDRQTDWEIDRRID